MPNTWVIDLRHYLTPAGALAPMPSHARLLAEYFASIVVDATSNLDEPPTVRCRRWPRHRGCTGIVMSYPANDEFDSIYWHCPVCAPRAYAIHGFAPLPKPHKTGGNCLDTHIGTGPQGGPVSARGFGVDMLTDEVTPSKKQPPARRAAIPKCSLFDGEHEIAVYRRHVRSRDCTQKADA